MNEPHIDSLFSTPVYSVIRDSELNLEESEEIKSILEEGMRTNSGNEHSINSYIFKTKLKKIKEFCEQQIKKYVEIIISPSQELEFYITESWINVTKPGEFHHLHYHPNSIISGVFYVNTVPEDQISFNDPNYKVKGRFNFGGQKEYNHWNSAQWWLPVEDNQLILFPSWLEHEVKHVEGNKNRISISFNTFVRGNLGDNQLNNLVLK
tara:strand:+ start:155 stop:778 length:624 start_codon:yes stop_codon:yes gene_type:complete